MRSPASASDASTRAHVASGTARGTGAQVCSQGEGPRAARVFALGRGRQHNPRRPTQRPAAPRASGRCLARNYRASTASQSVEVQIICVCIGVRDEPFGYRAFAGTGAAEDDEWSECRCCCYRAEQPYGAVQRLSASQLVDWRRRVKSLACSNSSIDNLVCERRTRSGSKLLPMPEAEARSTLLGAACKTLASMPTPSSRRLQPRRRRGNGTRIAQKPKAYETPSSPRPAPRSSDASVARGRTSWSTNRRNASPSPNSGYSVTATWRRAWRKAR